MSGPGEKRLRETVRALVVGGPRRPDWLRDRLFALEQQRDNLLAALNNFENQRSVYGLDTPSDVLLKIEWTKRELKRVEDEIDTLVLGWRAVLERSERRQLDESGGESGQISTE